MFGIGERLGAKIAINLNSDIVKILKSVTRLW